VARRKKAKVPSGEMDFEIDGFEGGVNIGEFMGMPAGTVRIDPDPKETRVWKGKDGVWNMRLAMIYTPSNCPFDKH